MNYSDLNLFPLKPGVYLMKDASGKILYIGKAKLLRERIKQYFTNQDTRAMIPFLISCLHEIETIVTFSEKEALLLENTLIKKYQPKYNILLKDDKTFISLFINHKHKWPQLKLVRHKEKKKEDGLYFGPYTSALSARAVYDTMTKVFPLRQCSDRELVSRKRACLLYSIKKCIAPCVNKCTKTEYDETVKEAILFLKGNKKGVIEKLTKKMEEASFHLEFEKAGAILKTIQRINDAANTTKSSIHLNVENVDALNFIRKGHYILLVKLLFRNQMFVGSEHFDFSLTLENDEEMLSSFILQHYTTHENPDQILLPMSLSEKNIVEEIVDISIETPQKGDKKYLVDLALENAKALLEQEKFSTNSKEELLLELKEILGLNKFPSRIECFDTSHISGTDAVATLAAFTNGEKDNKRSRLYKIKNEEIKDDYSFLHEVLTRRLTKGIANDDLPDLIIIDGGKGQLSTVENVFKELQIVSIDLISLVKEDAKHTKGATKEKIFISSKKDPISLNPHSSLHFFLQTIRDEAHRKAITYHRKKRALRQTKSILDEIKGIGPLKKKRLLTHFGSVKRIFEATENELIMVESISKKDALQILNYKKLI